MTIRDAFNELVDRRKRSLDDYEGTMEGRPIDDERLFDAFEGLGVDVIALKNEVAVNLKYLLCLVEDGKAEWSTQLIITGLLDSFMAGVIYAAQQKGE